MSFIRLLCVVFCLSASALHLEAMDAAYEPGRAPEGEISNETIRSFLSSNFSEIHQTRRTKRLKRGSGEYTFHATAISDRGRTPEGSPIETRILYESLETLEKDLFSDFLQIISEGSVITSVFDWRASCLNEIQKTYNKDLENRNLAMFSILCVIKNPDSDVYRLISYHMPDVLMSGGSYFMHETSQGEKILAREVTINDPVEGEVTLPLRSFCEYINPKASEMIDHAMQALQSIGGCTNIPDELWDQAMGRGYVSRANVGLRTQAATPKLRDYILNLYMSNCDILDPRNIYNAMLKLVTGYQKSTTPDDWFLDVANDNMHQINQAMAHSEQELPFAITEHAEGIKSFLNEEVLDGEVLEKIIFLGVSTNSNCGYCADALYLYANGEATQRMWDESILEHFPALPENFFKVVVLGMYQFELPHYQNYTVEANRGVSINRARYINPNKNWAIFKSFDEYMAQLTLDGQRTVMALEEEEIEEHIEKIGAFLDTFLLISTGFWFEPFFFQRTDYQWEVVERILTVLSFTYSKQRSAKKEETRLKHSQTIENLKEELIDMVGLVVGDLDTGGVDYSKKIASKRIIIGAINGQFKDILVESLINLNYTSGDVYGLYFFQSLM